MNANVRRCEFIFLFQAMRFPQTAAAADLEKTKELMELEREISEMVDDDDLMDEDDGDF